MPKTLSAIPLWVSLVTLACAGLTRADDAPAPGPVAGATQPAATQPTATQPSEHIRLRVIAAGPAEVDVLWSDVAGGFTRYFVERAVDEGKLLDFVKVGSAPAGTSNYQYPDRTVVAETKYVYRVRAVDPAGNVLYSRPAPVQTPEQKNILQALNGHDTVSLQEIVNVGFWQSSVKAMATWLTAFVPKLLVAVLLFLVFYGIHRVVRRVLVGSMNRAHVDPSIRDMLLALSRWGILGFGLVIACNQIGLQITALLTGVSIIGLAIGFAAQETLANFIAGVVIFWDKPFKVGDWITVDGQYGRVLRITFRSTRVLNLNGEILVVPNTYVLSTKLANHSSHPVNRLNVPLGIPPDLPVESARRALLAVTPRDDRLCDDPAPQVVVDAVTPGGVSLILRFWIKDESQERDIYHDYLEKAKNALDAVVKSSRAV